MITKIGQKFADGFVKYMPSAFVFALILTLVAILAAFFLTSSTPLTILSGWFNGFWSLLAFGMQIALIIVTAYSIAQSTPVEKAIDFIANYIRTPKQVYFWVVLIGGLLSLISFGMVVVVAILGRALAQRVKGINYPFLIACVYFSMNGWVTGASSSISLLLNTPDNFLISEGILTDVIPTSFTLGAFLNVAMILLFLILGPILFLFLAPEHAEGKELSQLMEDKGFSKEKSIMEEAKSYQLPTKSVSDFLNNAQWLQLTIVLLGGVYIVHHFITNGFDLNFNIMIFIFMMLGLLLHKTPLRYSISMQRASQNISGILFQYPFYAGIMGIMLSTGLGTLIGNQLSSVATLESYPFFAYVAGGMVNFAIPSAGGEFAVIGPSIIQVVQNLGMDAGLANEQITKMIARASMSVAYGESLSNLLQPFYLLVVFPVMGIGVKLQARDIIGYLVIPFILFFILQSLFVLYIPI
ncbi:short-chain fatty acid transporter [Maribacter aestuarii]|uniref:short-chain fatty acid transporter n=1 Tax=Maribacter aestuarii TaxID=1130723 RepID=UPI00248C8911|nr:TIGR00366 family protein [Maribacter aestuarii]